MNPRWVRSETIFDDETLTTAEGNGMQWAGQWSGYYPPTLCKLCFGEIICQIFLCCGWSGYYPPTSYKIMQTKCLGKLFVRFLKAMHNVTHQPVTIQINIMQTKCLRKYFFSDTSGENTTNQNKWPNIPSIEYMYLLIICWVDPKQLYICWCTITHIYT